MPTYRLTARNQFRSPSGAVGEAPDGPGSMATLLDDVDNYLGVGGAEHVGPGGSLGNIPTSRRFIGKLAYFQPTDITYRYVGAGNAVGGGTAQWQGWSKPPTSFAPVWAGAFGGTAPSVNVGYWGLTDGRLWVEILAVWNAGAFTMGANDGTVTIASTVAAGLFQGTGTFFGGGLTAVANDVALACWAPNGGATNQMRVRPLSIPAATTNAPVRPNFIGGVGITTASGDTIMLQASGPSAVVSTF